MNKELHEIDDVLDLFLYFTKVNYMENIECSNEREELKHIIEVVEEPILKESLIEEIAKFLKIVCDESNESIFTVKELIFELKYSIYNYDIAEFKNEYSLLLKKLIDNHEIPSSIKEHMEITRNIESLRNLAKYLDVEILLEDLIDIHNSDCEEIYIKLVKPTIKEIHSIEFNDLLQRLIIDEYTSSFIDYEITSSHSVKRILIHMLEELDSQCVNYEFDNLVSQLKEINENLAASFKKKLKIKVDDLFQGNILEEISSLDRIDKVNQWYLNSQIGQFELKTEVLSEYTNLLRKILCIDEKEVKEIINRMIADAQFFLLKNIVLIGYEEQKNNSNSSIQNGYLHTISDVEFELNKYIEDEKKIEDIVDFFSEELKFSIPKAWIPFCAYIYNNNKIDQRISNINRFIEQDNIPLKKDKRVGIFSLANRPKDISNKYCDRSYGNFEEFEKILRKDEYASSINKSINWGIFNENNHLIDIQIIATNIYKYDVRVDHIYKGDKDNFNYDNGLFEEVIELYTEMPIALKQYWITHYIKSNPLKRALYYEYFGVINELFIKIMNDFMTSLADFILIDSREENKSKLDSLYDNIIGMEMYKNYLNNVLPSNLSENLQGFNSKSEKNTEKALYYKCYYTASKYMYKKLNEK